MAITQENKAGYENTLESGKTAQGGTVDFINQKTKNVTFPIAFNSVPNIKIDLDAESNSIPYVVLVTLTGFQIKFRVNYTGNVIWSAIKVSQ